MAGTDDEQKKATEPTGDEPKGDNGQGDTGTGKPTGDEPKGDEEVLDTHGQPGINKERHEKEMAAKDAEIAKLKAQIDEAAKTEEGRDELKKKVAALEETLADEKVTHGLELAGCKNVKAAKALLGDYGNDVSKLKADCPYLFKDEKLGATGGKPQGGSSEAFDKKLEKAFGLN